MVRNANKMLKRHLINNINIYVLAILVFVIGISLGAITVAGLGQLQKEQLSSYLEGFFKLYKNQSIANTKILIASLRENFRLVAIIWFLGVTAIGVPLIFLMIALKGIAVGFTSGFIVSTMGTKGVLFQMITFIPKELIIIPCLMGLCISSVNFSRNMISGRCTGRLSKNDLKKDFITYCTTALCFAGIILAAILFESYISSIFIKILAKHFP